MPEDGEGSLKEVTGPDTPRESGEQTRPTLPTQPTLRAPSRGGSLRPRGASAHSAMAATRRWPRGRVCGACFRFCTACLPLPPLASRQAPEGEFPPSSAGGLVLVP